MQQFNMLTIENGKENPIAKMLLQMLSIGAEMENNHLPLNRICWHLFNYFTTQYNKLADKEEIELILILSVCHLL